MEPESPHCFPEASGDWTILDRRKTRQAALDSQEPRRRSVCSDPDLPSPSAITGYKLAPGSVTNTSWGKHPLPQRSTGRGRKYSRWPQGGSSARRAEPSSGVAAL